MKVSSFLLIILAFFGFCSCENKLEKEEKLARVYCSSCHQFPEPGLLPKSIWTSKVLPEMKFRMGLDFAKLSDISKGDYPFVLPAIPDGPMLSSEEWESIKNFYAREAPDSLTQAPLPAVDLLKQFTPLPISLDQNRFPLITLLKTDTSTRSIYTSNRKSRLHRFNYQFKLIDSVRLKSPASDLTFSDSNLIVTQLGIMDPNDQPKGSIGILDRTKKFEVLIDSLQRPVSATQADLNSDGLEDMIVCAFGNYTGQLLAFEKKQSGYLRHVVSPLPGARKVTIQDVNHDGLPDLLALLTQGDEQITLFINNGNFHFTPQVLLRFPPVYGSSYFELTDFNSDGHWDIIYSNGDNADFSPGLKPYHGIRFYQNDGKNQFTENFFFPLHGCTQLVARDFDKDGDVDVAALAFFANFAVTPERSFVYLENKNNTWVPFTTPLAARSRWILMDAFDIDEDNDEDIVLAALNMPMAVPESVQRQWQLAPTSLLLLENLQHP